MNGGVKRVGIHLDSMSRRCLKAPYPADKGALVGEERHISRISTASRNWSISNAVRTRLVEVLLSLG